MSKRRIAPVAALAVIALSLMTWPATSMEAHARSMPIGGDQPLRVNMNFSIQVPLADVSVDSIAKAQKANRVILYRLAQGECEALEELIAKTCRLNSHNLSSQVQNSHSQRPTMLRINLSARFTITLKDDSGG